MKTSSWSYSSFFRELGSLGSIVVAFKKLNASENVSQFMQVLQIGMKAPIWVGSKLESNFKDVHIPVYPCTEVWG